MTPNVLLLSYCQRKVFWCSNFQEKKLAMAFLCSLFPTSLYVWSTLFICSSEHTMVMIGKSCTQDLVFTTLISPSLTNNHSFPTPANVEEENEVSERERKKKLFSLLLFSSHFFPLCLWPIHNWQKKEKGKIQKEKE